MNGQQPKTIEQIIAAEVQKAVEPLEKQIATLTKSLGPLHILSDYFLLRQRDVPLVAGVSPRTLSNKIASDETHTLAQDGSRKRYITLGEVTNLKTQKRTKRNSNST
jgi:hypothetical protein